MLIRTAALLSLLILAAAPGAVAQDQPRAGGVLKAAMIGEPPSLYSMTSEERFSALTLLTAATGVVSSPK